MTPAETCVLFSTHVFAFVLIWFTSLAEGVDATHERPSKPAEGPSVNPDIRERLERSQHELIWNVAAFWQIKQ
jgi:hypothetical protein